MKKPMGLVIAVGGPKRSSEGAHEDSSDGDEIEKPSASEELIKARARAVGKVLGVPDEKQDAFAKALRAFVAICMTDSEY